MKTCIGCHKEWPEANFITKAGKVSPSCARCRLAWAKAQKPKPKPKTPRGFNRKGGPILLPPPPPQRYERLVVWESEDERAAAIERWKVQEEARKAREEAKREWEKKQAAERRRERQRERALRGPQEPKPLERPADHWFAVQQRAHHPLDPSMVDRDAWD